MVFFASLPTQPASAATPPDSCFAFNAGTGTITNYYAHEGNNPVNPACTRDVDIPSTIGGMPVTVIGNGVSYPGAFTGKGLTGVTLPNGVVSIGNSGFANNLLASVTIPDSVISIGLSAFSGNLLTSVALPSSITSISNYSFANNLLASVTIPNAATSIGTSSFYGNQLTEVTIPDGVTSIGDAAFSTNQISSLALPNSVTSIGNFAFVNNQLATVTIPNSVTSLGTGVFADNQLTSVSMSNSLTSIAGSMFARNQLTSIVIPTSVTNISGSAFAENQLTSLTVPASVTTVGDYAFYGNQLTNLTVMQGVTSIDEGAFALNRLTSVTIPGSVTSIGLGAFAVQGQWGRNIHSGANGAPYLFSSDPAEVQAVYDSLWYVRLYTQNPSNPNSLANGIASEDWWVGDDGNNNGTDDSLGGHIINPASAELQFVNSSSQSLQAPLVFTGFYSDDYLANYYVTQGPVVPVPSDPENPTPQEQQAIDDALAAYYRVGDTFTYFAPLVNGIPPTPSSYSFVLGASSSINTKAFVYNTAPPAASGGGTLAATGINTGTVVAIALLMITLATLLYKTSRSSGSFF